jgi:hypothetical protein
LKNELQLYSFPGGDPCSSADIRCVGGSDWI